ncbi:6710_t:CDS:1, partial [Acaulospora colombiana]
MNTATQKHNKLPENFIQNSCTFPIKQTDATVEKIAKVYRKGHGTTHLKTSFRFTYSITDTPSPPEHINRG